MNPKIKNQRNQIVIYILVNYLIWGALKTTLTPSIIKNPYISKYKRIIRNTKIFFTNRFCVLLIRSAFCLLQLP